MCKFYSLALLKLTYFDLLSLIITACTSLPCPPPRLCFYTDHHAILAMNPSGQRLAVAFLPSSKHNKPNPKVIGKNQYSTGTGLLPNAVWKAGTYNQKIAISREKRMAGNSHRFCVRLLKAGGCWKMLRRRVRMAIRTNHCL